jgi:hypothetical protein
VLLAKVLLPGALHDNPVLEVSFER